MLCLGDVYSSGNNDSGRLGHGDVKSCLNLKKIDSFGVNAGRRIVDIACGSNYSAAVSDKGK